MLVVLDLDQTLIHHVGRRYTFCETFELDNGDLVAKRPFLAEFLNFVFRNFRVAVWTAAHRAYASQVLSEIMPGRNLEFFFHSEHCNVSMEIYGVHKHLDMTSEKDVVIIDDNPAVAYHNSGRSYQIRPFKGDGGDEGLMYAMLYLKTFLQSNKTT